MTEINVEATNKVSNQIRNYFSSPGASPLSLAAILKMQPQYVQEAVFEFSLAFIQETASGDAYSTNMQHYRKIAEDIVNNL